MLDSIFRSILATFSLFAATIVLLAAGRQSASAAPIEFSGTGGPGSAVSLAAFEAAIGGADNGGVASPQPNGFRTINWDGVALNGTDFGGATQTIDLNHTVAIPINRFQTRGVEFAIPTPSPATASPASTPTPPACSHPSARRIRSRCSTTIPST